MGIVDPDLSAYRFADPVLTAWAGRHGIAIETSDRGWDIRSFWICDRDGFRRGKMWLQDADLQGNVTVIASELTIRSPSNWGPREERRVTPQTLEATLDELWSLMQGWAGPGFIASNYGLWPRGLQSRVPRWDHERGTERFPYPTTDMRGGGWLLLCLLLDGLAYGLYTARDGLLGDVAMAASNSGTFWPLLIVTALLLPALLFAQLARPRGTFRRRFMIGIAAAAIVLLVIGFFVALIKMRPARWGRL